MYKRQSLTIVLTQSHSQTTYRVYFTGHYISFVCPGQDNANVCDLPLVIAVMRPRTNFNSAEAAEDDCVYQGLAKASENNETTVLLPGPSSRQGKTANSPHYLI